MWVGPIPAVNCQLKAATYGHIINSQSSQPSPLQLLPPFHCNFSLRHSNKHLHLITNKPKLPNTAEPPWLGRSSATAASASATGDLGSPKSATRCCTPFFFSLSVLNSCVAFLHLVLTFCFTFFLTERQEYG